MAATLDDYLTVKRAAEYMGCTVSALRQRLLTGKLQPSHVIEVDGRGRRGHGCLLLFLPEDLDLHLKEHPYTRRRSRQPVE